MSASALKVVQLGQETTWGTAVVGSARLMGVTDCKMDAADKFEQPEAYATMYPSPLAALVAQSGVAKIEDTVTYEDLPYLLQSIFSSVSPTGTNPYTYTYVAPLGAVATPKAYTIEYGILGASQAYKLAGAVGQKLNIKGRAGGLWTASLDLAGKILSTVTLASLAERTVEVVRMSDSGIYIDAVGGTMGATVKASVLVSFELDVDTKRSTRLIAGSLNPFDYSQPKWSGTLKTVMEFNADAKVVFDAMVAPGLVQRQIEIRATSGTKSIKLQFAGYAGEPVTLWDDEDGNAIVEVTWVGEYNTTFASWLKAIVVNATATLA